jgi:hypothetical protein
MTSDRQAHLTLTLTADGRVLSQVWLRWRTGTVDRSRAVIAHIPGDMMERCTDERLTGYLGAMAWRRGYRPEGWEADPQKRCLVHLIHPDKSEVQCVLSRDHQDNDSDHLDEHGHAAPVLVTQKTIAEVRAVTEWHNQQRDLEREREQADAEGFALREWERAAQAAHDGEARNRPLLTAARLIEAGDRLAELVRETRESE